MNRRIVVVFMSLNAAYWILFFVHFFVSSQPFNPRMLETDLPRPFFVIANRAISPVQEHQGIGFRSMYMVQAPSIWLAKPVVWVVNKKPSLWERTFVGTSTGGYLLFTEVFFSFFQWLLVGSLVSYVVSRIKKR